MLLFLLLWGCTPTCEDACDQLVGCENPGTELLAADECRESCERQRDLYQHWGNEGLQDAFDASLNCYMDSSCDDIAAGVCYDRDIWMY